MVNRSIFHSLPQSLFLASVALPLLPLRCKADGSVPQSENKVITQYIEPAFNTINEKWKELKLTDQKTKDDILKKAFKNSTIQLPSEVLANQTNSLQKPQEHLNKLLEENKSSVQLSAQVLKAQLSSLENPGQPINELLDANKFKNGPIKLSPEVLKKLVEVEDPAKREQLIKDLLSKHYPKPEARQELINQLLENVTNQELLQNLSQDACTNVGNRANPTYAGVSPVLDWLNTAHFRGFFQPTMTDILVNRNKFNEFDSFNQWGLWGECFGFYSKLEREPKPLKLNMYTVGINVAGEKVFFERLVLGLGIAGSHSGIKWKDGEQDGSINSIYFGPSLNYIFSHGYLGCTLFGLVNFYKISRKTNLFPEKMKDSSKTTPEYQTWDLVARLEGGLSYEIWNQFFLYPTARIDYLNVFVRGNSEKIDDDTEIKLSPFNDSLLCSKAGLKLTKEFFYENVGFLIPSLSGGWINFTPLSTQKYGYEIEGCKEFEKEVEIGSWNQSYVGAGFTFVHERGILVSLDYEMTVGANSPVQAGSLRIEWSW